MGLDEIIGNYEPSTLWASSLEIIWVGDWKTSNSFSRHYTSKSMRQGGLSTAKRAGIPKALRMAQSGHRSQAHKVYESDSSSGDEAPGVPRAAPQGGWKLEDLYQFSRQFGL